MVVNLCLGLVGMGLVRVAPSIVVGGLGMFWCIFGLNINVNICYPFITETVSQRYRPMFSMLIAVFYALGSLGNVLWFYLLRNFEDVIIYCYGVPSILLTLAIIFFIQDAPICMITKSSPEKALQGLKHIAKVNQKVYFDLTIS